ncbi:glycerol-3-phosphate dehydrogenase/oxidase [Phaeovulum sp. W22_SRMD_FR3]|uniref:glycerol-3-phosphate dehydrogenase/oxidase n=1 Tax=Phaeovulum sp. W22_SRMD_FR3 TaxID=3240274 RepID=UPI003F9C63FD
MQTRDEQLARLRAGESPPVLIIGGGINGVGTYRDLAAQGQAALLVEAADFASGTSSAPSRLIHGGLRYLETGEAALVRESLTERNLLLKNACHVVHPLPVWVPLESWFRGSFMAVLRFLHLTRTPGAKGGVPVKLGLMLYDRFGVAHQTMPNHRMYLADAARKQVPVLAPNLRAVAEYYDASISHPERLVAELVADAERDCPAAMAIPYLAAGALRDGAVTLTDTLTGERFEVRPTVVVNAAGAWADGVQENLGFHERMIGGTRGSHLVVKSAALVRDLAGKMLYFETLDHRACLIYAIGEDRLLLGTTDLRSDDANDKFCTEAEIDYLFHELSLILPGVQLTRADIVFAYAGVRPLPLTKPGATGAISRDHKLVHFPPTAGRPFPLVTLIGGKWTTYRVCGEQIADAVLAHLGAKRRQSTEDLPIGGARGFPFAPADRAAYRADLAAQTGLSPERCAVLAARYGSRARDVALAEAAEPGMVAGISGYSSAEITLLCRDERVTRLEDVVLRRTLMAFEGAVTVQGLAALASLVGAALHWDATREAGEAAATLKLLQDRHRMTIG